MSHHAHAPSYSVEVSSTETRYPLLEDTRGTTTAGSSDLINRRVISIDFVIVEAYGSADGVLTISDHAGTAGKSFDLAILTATRQPIDLGPKGMHTGGWTGLKVALTGTAQRVRVGVSAL